MDKWEVTFIKSHVDTINTEISSLHAMGAEGWEPFSVLHTGTGNPSWVMIFLKRKL